MITEKESYCRYDTETDIEYARGCLRLYLPSEKGYVNFNIVHSVRKEITADIWRLGIAFAYDDALESCYPLTRFGAEWDMAVHIDGRDDFIGGSNHGDEIFTSFALTVDGVPFEPESLTELTPFKEIKVNVSSIGYDPDDHLTKSLIHHKEYTVNRRGVEVSQRVEWQKNYKLSSCYLAMMPPLKSLTDSYFTDADENARSIVIGSQETGIRSVTLYGKESGVSFTMSIPEYPVIESGGQFLITDNNNSPYNKMYFFVCKKAEVCPKDLWKSTTRYEIKVK